MKQLNLSDIEWRLECEPEDMQIEGNASAIDEETDKATCDWIGAELESGNHWAWCRVIVRGSYKGLTAFDSLCGCSYKSREDFTVPGGYYDDMRGEVLAQLQNQLEAVCADCN